MSIEFSHRSVMLNECIDGLNIKPDGIYVDGTCGGAGHSFEIAKRLDTGKLICIDQDPDAIAAASKRLEPYKERVIIVKSNFSEAAGVCRNLGYDRIDGLLLDLGVSSFQLDEASRGFSYNADAPLDMRMSDTNPLTAYEVVNSYSESELKRILFEYGEERFAGRIASKIVNARAIKPIETTIELSELIKSAIPSAARNGGHHPAKRSFQAIRIEVNGELDVIAPTIETVCGVMNSGGRMAIISFHSLEDRAVKQAYQKLAEGCTCPKDFPVCVCGNNPKIKIITKKPIVPSETELEENPRSRSAKLRIAEKI